MKKLERMAQRLILTSSILLVVGLVAGPANSDTGGWVSSGGELFRYGKNPWFLKNTAVVEYCTRFDAASISATELTTKAVIKEAIAYWQSEFAAAALASGPTPGFAQVGTQTFQDVGACNALSASARAQVGMEFVFGEAGLESDERKTMVDPRNFVGLSIRKSYDLVSLSGKGIVYIASDIGPNAYNTAKNSAHLFAEAWREKKLLLYSLIHELGHVFGIPHMGEGIMSEVFLEQLLNKRFVDFYVQSPLQTFLTPPLNFEICSMNGTFDAAFFQVPAATVCMRFEGRKVGPDIEWQIYSRSMNGGGPETKAGTLKASKLSSTAFGTKPAVVIQLPAEQTVFTLTERMGNTFLIGPVFGDGTAQGIFQTVSSHRPHDVQVELKADAIVMTAVTAGRMKPVLVYSQPSLLSRLYPL